MLGSARPESSRPVRQSGRAAARPAQKVRRTPDTGRLPPERVSAPGPTLCSGGLHAAWPNHRVTYPTLRSAWNQYREDRSGRSLRRGHRAPSARRKSTPGGRISKSCREARSCRHPALRIPSPQAYRTRRRSNAKFLHTHARQRQREMVRRRQVSPSDLSRASQVTLPAFCQFEEPSRLGMVWVDR